MDERNVKILIRGVNWLGDAVMSLPAIQAVIESSPRNSVWVLTPKKIEDLYQCVPGLKTLGFEWARGIKGSFERFSYGNKIKTMGFTHTFIFPNSFDAALVPFVARIPVRTGYRRNGRGFMLTQNIKPPENYFLRHHKYHYLEIVRQSGFLEKESHNNTQIFPLLKLTQAHILKLPNLRHQLKLPEKKHEKWVALFPGAEYGVTKKWPLEYFIELSKRFLKYENCRLLVFGLKKDHADADNISALSDRVHNLAGKSSLLDLILLLSMCDYAVSNDSGGMHLSAALGLRGVAVFGSTSPFATGPVLDTVKVVYHKAECSPCFKRTCSRGDLMCLHSVSVDHVWKECLAWL